MITRRHLLQAGAAAAICAPMIIPSEVLAGGLWLPDYQEKPLSDDDALAAAIDDIRSESVKTKRILFSGNLCLTRQPPSIHRIHVEGDMISDMVVKQYPGGILFRFAGPPGYSGGGLYNMAFGDEAGGGTTIFSQGNGTYEPDQIRLENLYMNSYGKRPFRHIHLIGQRISPQGIRGVAIRNVTAFGTTNSGSVYLRNIEVLDIDGLNLYPGSALWADLYVLGPSPDVPISDPRCEKLRIQGGALNIGNIIGGSFEGTWNSVSSAGGVTNTRINGRMI
jgi:hypothetical protein